MQQNPVLARHRATIGALAVCAVGVALLGWHFWLRTPDVLTTTTPSEPSYLSAEEPTPSAATTVPPIIVYVSGAVNAPNVYELPVGARLRDAVVAAGGLSAEADADAVNLAAKVSDGQHVQVQRRGQVTAAAEPGATADTGPQLVDLNQATLTELDGLPGIGQATAERIIEYRQTNGPFQVIEDLQKVKGIGPALAKRLAALVTVGS